MLGRAHFIHGRFPISSIWPKEEEEEEGSSTRFLIKGIPAKELARPYSSQKAPFFLLSRLHEAVWSREREMIEFVTPDRSNQKFEWFITRADDDDESTMILKAQRIFVCESNRWSLLYKLNVIWEFRISQSVVVIIPINETETRWRWLDITWTHYYYYYDEVTGNMVYFSATLTVSDFFLLLTREDLGPTSLVVLLAFVCSILLQRRWQCHWDLDINPIVGRVSSEFNFTIDWRLLLWSAPSTAPISALFNSKHICRQRPAFLPSSRRL